MAEKLDVSPIGEKHWTAFGAIVRQFARTEALIAVTIGWLTETPLPAVMMLLEGLPYAGKRNAVLSVIHGHPKVSKARAEKIVWFLGNIHQHNKLRNWICHSQWGKGTRADSVKPGYIDVRSGKGTPYGHLPDERDYTLKELFEITQDLMKQVNALTHYLADEGAFDAIERHMVSSSWMISGSDGAPPDK